MRHGVRGGRRANTPLRRELDKQASSFTKILLNILRSQGVRGLYKGMESKILQTVLTSALMLVIYEKIHRWVCGVLLLGRGVPKK